MISHERPKIFDKFERAFGAKWNDGVVVAWDGMVYCKNEVPPDVLAHEKIHLEQQKGMGKERWLRLYLNDQDFRFEMEKQAYIAQADFIKKFMKQRNHLYLCIREVAQDFVSSLYGYELTLDEAMKILYP